jgi:hypothetical protein
MSNDKKVKSRVVPLATPMISTVKLKIDKLYFLDKFEKGQIGITYLFSPDQIAWLEQSVGKDWNRSFVKNQIVGRFDPGHGIQSTLRQFGV